MQDVIDSYTAHKSAASTAAFKPIKELDKKYQFLIGFHDTEAKDSWIAQVFELFTKCPLTASGEYSTEPAMVLTRIKDENGAFENHHMDSVPYGWFVRNDLPMWIIQILNELTLRMIYTFGTVPNKYTIPIETNEHFDSWLGEDPLAIAFTDDVVFVKLSKAEINSTLGTFAYRWELPEQIVIPMMIGDISSEEITLIPNYSLGRLIPIKLTLKMDEFKEYVLKKNVVLMSVLIDNK